MGTTEPAQGTLVNGRGRTSCCLFTYRTRQVKALHVVDVIVGRYPMPVDKQGTNVTVYSN